MTSMQPAAPKYALEQEVTYVDHHKRTQRGKVGRIEAYWPSYGGGTSYIVYTIHHPTYRNCRMHVGESDILGPAEARG